MNAELQRQNDADLQAFIAAMFPDSENLALGRLVGPLPMRTGSVSEDTTSFLIGKIRCDLGRPVGP